MLPMKHRDFIREVANKTDTSQEKVDLIIDTALHSIKKLLANNDSITFHGFGKLDRLSRSLKDLLVIIDRINKKEAGFKSLTENIDTTTASGRMMMQMVGAFAEFEREMVRERTKAGLDAALAEGRVGGRKPKLKANQRKDIIDNVMTGRKSGAEMARLYNVSEATISRTVAQYRILQEKME